MSSTADQGVEDINPFNVPDQNIQDQEVDGDVLATSRPRIGSENDTAVASHSGGHTNGFEDSSYSYESPFEVSHNETSDETPPPLPTADREGSQLSTSYSKQLPSQPLPASLQEPEAPNIDMSDIQIIDAIKTNDGPGSSSYVAYVIRSGSTEARRRYSEFASLRAALVALYPTVIVPPIPSKQTLTDYAAKGVGVGLSKAKDDPALIARRRRMLGSFLQRTARHLQLKECGVLKRFLDGRFPWHQITSTPPLSTLPRSLMRAAVENPGVPTDASAAYSTLPLPPGSDSFVYNPNSSSGAGASATAGLSLSSSSSAGGTNGPPLKQPNQRFLDSEAFTNRFANHVVGQGGMEKVNRRVVKRWTDLSADHAELGAVLNGFALSLPDAGGLALGVERTGQASDATFLAIGKMLETWEHSFTEPLSEYGQFAGVLQRLLKWRHLKHAQLELAQDVLAGKKAQLADLERVEDEAQRLDRALERGGRGLVGAGSSASGGPSDARRARQASSVDNDTWHRRSLYGAAAEAELPSKGLAASHLGDGEDWTTSVSASPDPRGSPTNAPTSPRRTAADLNTRAPIPSSPPPRSGGYGAGLLGAISHTFHAVMDVDPDATRRNNIGKLRETIGLLEEGTELLASDLRKATQAIQADLDRFQRQKVSDLRDMALAFATAHRDFCEANLKSWRGAREEIGRIQAVAPGSTAALPGSGRELPSSRLRID